MSVSAFSYEKSEKSPEYTSFEFTTEKIKPELSITSENEDGDGYWENGHFIRKRGLHWFITSIMGTTSLFFQPLNLVVGELAGGGLVALPVRFIFLHKNIF